MLVLTRKEGESLLIGNNVEIKIVSVDGRTVRLSIRAPKAVTIVRKELKEQVEKANVAAAELGRRVGARATAPEKSDDAGNGPPGT